jgi:hypothetical protein
VGTVVDSYCVVAIVCHEVGDTDVRGADIECIRVEWEALPFVRYSVDDRIRDIDIAPLNLNIPRNGLARLETLDASALDVKHHQVWASGDTGCVRGVGIPPLLSIRVDPAVIGVCATSVVDVRATEVEPPDGLRAREDELASGFNVLREMQVAKHLDVDIRQFVCEDGFEDIVVHACRQSGLWSNAILGVRLTFGEHHRAAICTIRER